MVQAEGNVQFFVIYFGFKSLEVLISVHVLVQLGANAILAVSLAVCKAGASVLNIPLYKVLFSPN